MYDVIIIGSGPAGLTAAIYTTRANLKTLIIAGVKWGGQLQLTSLVENFPGFPEGIQGPDLMEAMRKQAEHHGAEIVEENLTAGDFTRLPSSEGGAYGGQGKMPFVVSADGKTYEGKAVIIASGADPKWLGVPGEEEKIGKGVSNCATCDAAFFRNKDVIVAGGGDSAMEEALVLSRVAKSVTIVHRRDSFRASQIMQDRVKQAPNIKILFDSQVVEVIGQTVVEKIKVKNVKTGEISEMPINGVFVAIGHIPNTSLYKGVDLDDAGYVKVLDHYKTNIEGVFVAGDVHDRAYRQAVTAAGYGSAAALEVERWLSLQKT